MQVEGVGARLAEPMSGHLQAARRAAFATDAYGNCIFANPHPSAHAAERRKPGRRDGTTESPARATFHREGRMRRDV